VLHTLPLQFFESEPGLRIAYKTLGDPKKPAMLMLHGHPQTHMIWHKIAADLAEKFFLVLPDLRGYGQSSKPAGLEDHSNYSKRAMGADCVRLMAHLGIAKFRICAHDRGARVAHRLALDAPQAVEKLMLLDIAPTLAMYEQTTETFARAYWHWFFLIQRSPMPERLIIADPKAYLEGVMGSRHAGLKPFTAEAMADYLAGIQGPESAHSLCEDYRAAAGIDLEHDRASRTAGAKLEMPLAVHWGADGVIQRCFKPLEEWGKCATNITGSSLPCGHYVPEEAPAELKQAILAFF
jgi:haloacetate dehalogenase